MTEYEPPRQPDPAAAPAAPARRPTRLRPRRFLLRVLLPLVLYLGGLFLWGVHEGARAPDAWYTRAVAWLAE